MKKLLAVAALILLSAIGLNAQTQTTTITIVAAASLGTITPTPAHFYQNVAAPISLASSTSGFSTGCTATISTTGSTTTTAVSLTYSSTTLALTGTLSAAQTNVAPGSVLTVTVTCPLAPLTMNSPVVLPNAQVGAAYSASLLTLTGLSGGVPPYTWTVSSGSLPAGLALSSSGNVTGTPSGAGSSTFGFTVTDSSGVAFNFTPPVLPFRDRSARVRLRG
jgi:large repetitive protein